MFHFGTALRCLRALRGRGKRGICGVKSSKISFKVLCVQTLRTRWARLEVVPGTRWAVEALWANLSSAAFRAEVASWTVVAFFGSRMVHVCRVTARDRCLGTARTEVTNWADVTSDAICNQRCF